MGPPLKPAILVVPGAWHRGVHWSHQLPEFAALGYQTLTVENPSCSGTPGITIQDDVNAIQCVLLPLIDAGREVVVVAHSYGGIPAGASVKDLAVRSRQAEGKPGGVLGIIFVAGLVSTSGEDHGVPFREGRLNNVYAFHQPREGLFVCSAEDARRVFYAPDVPAALAEEALAWLRPQSMAASFGVSPDQGWLDQALDGRRAYVRCGQDRALRIALQDGYIARAGEQQAFVTRTLEESGHSPFLSMPKVLAETVDDIVMGFYAV